MKKLALLVILSACAERTAWLEVQLSLKPTTTVALSVATIAIEEAELIPCAQQAWGPRFQRRTHTEPKCTPTRGSCMQR